MGHIESAHLNKHMSKKEVIDYVKPISQMPFSVFRQERIVIAFFHNNQNDPNADIAPNHNPPLLASLLLGCYEQLDHIPFILENLIQISQEPDNPLVSELNINFNLFTFLANARQSMLDSISQFSLKSFCPFTETPSKKDSFEVDFLSIVNVFQDCLKDKFKVKSKTNEMSRVFKHFKHSTPASAFPPPTPDFFPKGIGNIEPFSARRVIVHGICSNGQFLFVLCRESLEIFSLLNMGSLIPPITRQFDTPFDTTASIVADSTHLRIYVGDECREYSIFDIFQKNLTYTTKAIAPNYICYVSDGILTARVENINRDFHVQIFEGKKFIRKIKLVQGNATLHSSIPNLFPHTDYSLIPIEINGPFISFMFRINPVNIVYRVFSLISGVHVYDDLFTSSDMCYASQTDTINKCHWTISVVEGNKLGVKRFLMPGSINPRLVDMRIKKKSRKKKNYENFVTNFNETVVHYTDSNIYPKCYIADTLDELYLLFDLIIKYIEVKTQDLAVQSMVIVLELNLKQTQPEADIRDKLLDLVQKLPLHLQIFLFFGALNHFLYEYTKKGISMLVDLISKTKLPNLLQYAYHKLESSYILAEIPFDSANAFNSLIPNNTNPDSDTQISLQTLIFIHQRILIAYSSRYVNDPTFNEIQFCSRTESKTPLDFLNQYSSSLLKCLHDALEKCNNIVEIDNSFIMLIMSNFLKLLTSLASSNIVAQFLTDTFASLLNKINKFVIEKSLDLTDGSILSNNVRLFLFVYGKLSATLLKGTNLSDFEKKFIHIIRSNLESTNDILDPNMDNINKSCKKFLTKKKTYQPTMDLIYEKYKPFMHKNLSKQLKNLDKTSLLAICKHLQIENELLDLKQPFSPKMKTALEQMLKVRHSYRNMQQSAQECHHLTKCNMLLKMSVDSGINASEIGDFISSKESPEDVLNMLVRQKIRTDLTIKGFSLMKKVLSFESNNLFIDIFSYALAQIEKFTGLSSILTIIQGTKLKEVESLFETIMKIIQKRPKINLIITVFRFFRDCRNLNNIESNFLKGILDIFSENDDNYALFALSLSLLPSINEMPKVLNQPQQSPMGWLLQSTALTYVQATVDFYKGFKDVFWNCKPVLKRILCRVMFRVLNSQLLSEKVIREEFVRILSFIGQTFIEFSDIATANEMIWLLRRFLTEKTYSCPFLMDIILNVDHNDDRMVCGVFAVLGNSIELIRPYCNIKSHNNRTTTSEYIAIPTSQKTQFFCYERPFDLNKRPFNLKVSPHNLIYAVAVVVLDTHSFDNFDFILSFFNECFDDLASIRSMLYVQVLGHFMKYNEFVEKITPEMINVLSLSPLPFHTIHTIVGLIRGFQMLPDLETVDGFYQIQYNSTSYVSYISPQLKPGQKFDLSFEINSKKNSKKNNNETKFYFGIISDDIERYFTRYSVVCSPSGILYPFKEKLRDFKPSNEMTFFINTIKNKLVVGDEVIDFPRGDFFRIIIATDKSDSIKIHCDSNVFNKDGVPAICQHGAIMADNVEPLFNIPKVIQDFKEKTLPSDLDSYPEVDSIVKPISIKTKLTCNFQEPPDYISIHCGFATHASKGLVEQLNKGLLKTISLQWTTICLMRIAIQKPLVIKNPIKLFTLISIPLEPFSVSSYINKKFPFSLSPSWEFCNTIYLSLENDAKSAIQSILSSDDTIDQLCMSLYRMSESRELHLICHPHILHSYHPPGTFKQELEIKNKFSICTINSFTPMRHGSIKVNDKKENLPFIVTKGPTTLVLNDEILKTEFSIFAISQTDNTFAFDTGFEVLLILKNLLYVAKTPKQKYVLKSAFANMFIAQSPFVLRYLAQIADHIELRLPPSPYDYSKDSFQRMLIMGSLLKSSVYSDRFLSFLSQESRILNNQMLIELTKHFPEFLPIVPEKPTQSKCIVPIVSLDPGTIKEDFPLRIRTLRLFSRSYKSLVGFPFWEILPYWLRITGAWRSSHKATTIKKKSDSDDDNDDESNTDDNENENDVADNPDEIDPTIESYNADIMHISNPTGEKISIRIRHAISMHWPASSMVMISPTPLFENSLFFNGKQLSKPIEISGTHQYIALLDVPGGWDAIRIEFTNWKKYKPPPPENIDMTSIHDQFVQDMNEFAIQWQPEDTEELIMILPRYALIEPTYGATETIAKNCSLTHKFSTNVVLLRSLLIHQFNYIRTKQRNEVPKSLWDSMTSFVSCEDAADDITSCIVCGKSGSFANFTIDRHAAQRLVVEGRGHYSRSILSQLTVAFKKVGKECLQCKKRPWKVKFANELAIDAGGPTRELMTEVAASIFEPTTEVFIPVPNSKLGEVPNKDTFIPWDKNGNRAPDYATIGTYLGIVLRTGLAQDLPFAPLVWKYLAKEPIGPSDVYAIDSALEEQVKNVKLNCELGYAQWQVEAWDGTMTALPGHAPDTLVRPEEASQYVNEIIAYRIASLKPMLKMMRAAFRENVGFDTHPLLTGKLLSRMAQGSSVIATEHLKAITVVTDYDGVNDPFVLRFWRAIDRFTSDQRRLLLKFVTTLTRPPNSTINPDFRIQIDRMSVKNPDDMLPTASTCFNRLHLPPYTNDDVCYEKLLYAVQYCQSMENK